MSQRQSLTQGVGHTQTVKEQQRAIQIQKQKNEQLQDQQFEAEIEELEDMQDDEVVPVADAPEIHDVDTSGDSDAFVEPEGASSPFELEWVGPLPRVRDLPSRACPRVLCRLSENFEYSCLTRSKNDPEGESLREAIAQAVTEHIKGSGVQLKAPGDWVNIPAIVSNDALVDLAPENQVKKLQAAAKNRFRQLKSFAVGLPNGDVVTVDALVDRGLEKRKATRAGALRLLAAGKVRKELAGEEWTEADWRQLNENEEEARRKRRKRSKSATSR